MFESVEEMKIHLRPEGAAMRPFFTMRGQSATNFRMSPYLPNMAYVLIA